MKAPARLAAYGLLLAAVLGAGAAVGAAAGPIDVSEPDEHATEHVSADPADEADLGATGVLVSQGGYTFQPEDRLADAGELAFSIIGPDGTPVTSYDELHERALHLIVASRDLRHYAHLHPVLDEGGRWSADLPSLPAGPYRAFADFKPAGGQQHTLGVDLLVPGTVTADEPLQAEGIDTVGGYEVSLDAEDHGGAVTVTVRRNGEEITTEPYLGAAGHLVALRDGDLAYLHVHPLDEDPDGPVRFAIEVPSAGTYALFFDFQVDGTVHTARFVMEVDATRETVAGHGDHDTDH